MMFPLMMQSTLLQLEQNICLALKAFQLDKLHDQVKACIEDLKSVKFAGNEDAAVLIIEGILIFEDK